MHVTCASLHPCLPSRLLHVEPCVSHCCCVFSWFPAFVCYLLSNLWMNNGGIRRHMADLNFPSEYPDSSQTPSNQTPSFEDIFRYNLTSPKPVKGETDFLASSPESYRLVKASLSLLSVLVFHPTINFGATELSDTLLSLEGVPRFITQRRRDLKSSESTNCSNREFALVSTKVS